MFSYFFLVWRHGNRGRVHLKRASCTRLSRDLLRSLIIACTAHHSAPRRRKMKTHITNACIDAHTPSKPRPAHHQRRPQECHQWTTLWPERDQQTEQNLSKDLANTPSIEADLTRALLRLVRRRRPSVRIVLVQAALSPSTIAHTWCHEPFVHSAATRTSQIPFFSLRPPSTPGLQCENIVVYANTYICLYVYVGAFRCANTTESRTTTTKENNMIGPTCPAGVVVGGG